MIIISLLHTLLNNIYHIIMVNQLFIKIFICITNKYLILTLYYIVMYAFYTEWAIHTYHIIMSFIIGSQK